MGPGLLGRMDPRTPSTHRPWVRRAGRKHESSEVPGLSVPLGPPAEGGQSCWGCRGQRPPHQSPEGQQNPTPPSPALPLGLPGGDRGCQAA